MTCIYRLEKYFFFHLKLFIYIQIFKLICINILHSNFFNIMGGIWNKNSLKKYYYAFRINVRYTHHLK